MFLRETEACCCPEPALVCWQLTLSKVTPHAGNNMQQRKGHVHYRTHPCSNLPKEENIALPLKCRWKDMPVCWELTHQRSCFDWFSILAAVQLLKGHTVVCPRILVIQIKKAQEACSTEISVFSFSNNWPLLFLEIATYNKKTRNHPKRHIFQDVFPSQLSQLFCPESQIPYPMTLFHSPLHHETSQCQQPHHANDCERFRVCLWKNDWLNNDKGRKKFYEVTLTFPQKATSEGRKEGRQLDSIH